MSNTYLSFKVCNEYYAINVDKVLEVLQKQKITRVPNAPGYIRGIINFRGEVVPVFESRNKFSLPERGTENYVVIVLDLSKDNDNFLVGVMVDKVKDVINIEELEIKKVPTMGKNFNSEFISGIYKSGDEFIMLLNIEKIFSEQEYDQMKLEVLNAEASV
jgi:purine-binding chemotaxis protein CheW